MGIRIAILLLLAFVAALQPRAACAGNAQYPLKLAKGRNFVSLPLSVAATSTSSSVVALFGSALEKIDTIEYFDTKSGRWLIYDTKSPGEQELRALPDASAFYVYARQECSVNVYGLDSDFSAPALEAGWNALGVMRPVTVGVFAAGVDGFDPLYDRIYRLDDKGAYVALLATETLEPGKGYWLDNDPDGDGVKSSDEVAVYGTSPAIADLVRTVDGRVVKKEAPAAAPSEKADQEKIKYLADQCGETYNPSQSLDERYASCRKWVSDLAEYTDAGPDVSLGGFTVSQVRYKLDPSGKRIAGIGLLRPENLPQALGALFRLGGDETVFLDLKDGEVLRAVGESVKAFTVGGSAGLSFDSGNSKPDLMTIEADGSLEIGMTAKVDALPERVYFLRWSPPAENGVSFLQLGLLLGDEEEPGDEVTASRVWYLDGETPVALRSGERLWFLKLPPATAGVFEPYLKTGEREMPVASAPSPFAPGRKGEPAWLPAQPEPRGEEIAFVGPVAGVRFMSALGQDAADSLGVGESDLVADEKGRLLVTGSMGDPARAVEYLFDRGALVTRDPGTGLALYFKGWKRTPDRKGSATKGVLSWSPSLKAFWGAESVGTLKEVSVAVPLSVEVGNSFNAKAALKDKAGAVADLKLRVLGFDWGLDGNLLFDFDGYQTGVSAGIERSKEEYARSGGESRMLVSALTTLRLPALATPDMDIVLAAKVREQYVAPLKAAPPVAVNDREGYQSRIDLEGEGRYRLPADLPLIGGSDLAALYRAEMRYKGKDGNGKRKYLAKTQLSFGVAEGEEVSRGEDGWSFGIDELKFELADVEVTGGDSQLEAVTGYLRPTAPRGLKSFTGFVTLNPPADFVEAGPFAGSVVAERLTDSDAAGQKWRLTVSADIDVRLPLEGDDNYLLLKRLLGAKQTGENWSFGAAAELHLGARTVEGTLYFQKGGTYTLVVKGYDLDDTLKGVDLTMHLVKGAGGKWDWTASLGGTVSGKAIAALLGQDPSLVDGDVNISGTLSSTRLSVSVASIPFNWGGLPEWIVLDKIGNVTYTREKTSGGDAASSYAFDVDVIFTHFADQRQPRDRWPRFSMGGVYSQRGLLLSGRNFPPLDIGDGTELTLVEAGVGFEKDNPETNKSKKVSGTVRVKLSESWRKPMGPHIRLPEELLLGFEYSKDGFRARHTFEKPAVIDLGGGTVLKLNEMLFKKASPWSSGLAGTLTMAGQEVAGIVELGKEPRFVLADRNKGFSIDLTGGYRVAVSNLGIDLGPGFAVSGDAVVTMPQDNPLKRVVGKSFAAKVSGSPERYSLSTRTNISSTMDLGLLGKASFTITTLSLSSDGAFAGSGTVTVQGQKTGFVIGVNGGGLYFLADFGDKGIEAKLARVFTLKLKKSLGLESVGPYQYLRVDDLKAGLGDQMAGADLASQRFLYLLPSAVPPAGFAFFDNLEGKVHIAGFGVNVGMSFPAPGLRDLGPVVKVLGGAFAGGKVDRKELEKLTAPAFTLRDVALDFPRVPGYAWKEGRVQRTDNVFGAIFGADRLDLVKSASLAPKDFVEMVTADAPMDAIKVALPADKRKGRAGVDLLGFKTDISYDLRAEELLYEKRNVPKLPQMYAFLDKLRYVDRNSGELPEELRQKTASDGTDAAAGRSKTVEVLIPPEKGGGTAQVTWTVEDISAELNEIKGVLAAVTPARDSRWQDHLQSLWRQFSQKGLSFNGNRAAFRYSPAISAELELTEYDGNLDITGLKSQGGALAARFGAVTLYTDKEFQGQSLTISDDLSESAMASSAIGARNLSSVKIDGRGKATLDAARSMFGIRFSQASELTGSLETLDDSKVTDNAVTSVKLYYPISVDKVTGWRLIFKTEKGIVATVDGGGIEVVFPGDSTALSLLPNGRLSMAMGDTRKVLEELKPYPALDADPARYIDSVWREKMLPWKEGYLDNAADDDVNESEKPVEFRRADGGAIGFLPLSYGAGKKVGGLKFDKATGTLSGRFGKTTLFAAANYQGDSLVVEDDIPDLGETGFGNDAASSVKVEDGASATLFSGTNFTERWYYDYTTLRPRHSNKCVDVYGAGRQSGANIMQWDCNGGDNQLWKLVAHDDWFTLVAKHSGKCADVYGGNTANGGNIAQWDCHGGPNQDYKLIPRGGDAYALQGRHSGKCVDVAGEGTHAGANIQQWDCHNGGGQAFLMNLNKKGFLTTALDRESGWLGEQPIGNDSVRSVRVYAPLLVEQVKEWKLLQGIPTGGSVVLAYVKDTSDGIYKSVISTELKGTRNKIESSYDAGGNLSVSAGTESGAQYPLTGFRVYVKGTPYELKEITEAARYVRIVTKTVKMPDGATAVLNEEGGITAVHDGVAVSPAEGAPATTVFTLPGPDGTTLRFNITRAGGFGAAQIVGADPARYAPLYEDDQGVPQGVKKVVGKIDGGFFVDAGLNLGSSDTVQVSLHVSGSIKTDGNYYLKGNGNLVVADFEVSDAVIELSSDKGLRIRGKMDLYGTKVDIDGSLTPDNRFSFTGVAQIMVSGNGVKGTLAVDNGGMNINGGVYLGDKKIKSGVFAVEDGKVSWKTQINIGYAGFDADTWIRLKSPFGPGYSGRAYINVKVPIYVWGPRGWKCKRKWGIKVCWPRDWGNVRVGTLRLHYNQPVGGELSGSALNVKLGRAKLKVNLAKPSLSADW